MDDGSVPLKLSTGAVIGTAKIVRGSSSEVVMIQTRIDPDLEGTLWSLWNQGLLTSFSIENKDIV